VSAAGDEPGSSPGDWDAATYDRISDPMTRWGEDVLARLDLRGDETVLDAGCGSGRVTETLLGRLPTGRVVAFDAAPSMLAEARKRLDRFAGRVHFVEGDLLELSPDVLGQSAPVDAVLSTATFHWVLDHDRLFANLAAVMRPGAALEAQCGAAGNIARLLEAVRTTGDDRAGTWLYATPEETRARLERAGFEDAPRAHAPGRR
jgi:trans-aconitate 2-methyltransferase